MPTNHGSQLWSRDCKKLARNRVQERTTHGQVSCTSRLVQVSCTRFLTVCHRLKFSVYDVKYVHCEKCKADFNKTLKINMEMK